MPVKISLIKILTDLGYEMVDIETDEDYLSALREGIVTIEAATKGSGDKRSEALREEFLRVRKERKASAPSAGMKVTQKKISPSKRGELEITSINEYFLKAKKLNVEPLNQEFIWLDTGTLQSLIDAGQFIETIEKRKGIKVACLEELAFQKGYINKKQLIQSASKMEGTSYGNYLKNKYSK